MELKSITSIKGMLEKASEAEEAGDIGLAIETYKTVISLDKFNEQAYERLMIMYRKSKEYKKELTIIDAGIKAFEKLYKPKATGRMKKVAELSLKMAKSVGLVDKKGETTYEFEPLGKWKKRRLVVEKKLG